MAKNLRQEARGKPCMIRIPGVCNGNSETVVLCHIHKPSISGGMGMKAVDLLASWGCSDCHDAVDGRSKYDYGNTDLFLYEGVFRTQNILLNEGKIGELT